MTIGSVIVSVSGNKQLLQQEQVLLAHPKVGGVILFQENWAGDSEDPLQTLKELIAQIHSINPQLLVMVDHEGGYVWRFDTEFTKLPSAKSIGELYMANQEQGLSTAFEYGRIMASELLACGVNLSLAPVLDLDGSSNIIGKLERAFHNDPKIVALLAEQFIQGMHAAGMPATAKHFPGHGSCILDSHVALPIDDRPLIELENDLYPFKTLIEQELLEAVMTAHVVYPAFDPEHVASLSSIWIQEYLREELGFQGVIMSDCLSMEGANVGTSLDKLSTAVQAGNDFLIFTHQHGPLLDELLAALDQLPDTQDSQERRQLLVDQCAVSGSELFVTADAAEPIFVMQDYDYALEI